MIAGKREARRGRPRMEQDDGPVSVGHRRVHCVARDATTRCRAPPVEPVHVPACLAIAESLEGAEDTRIVRPGSERTAEPRPRVLAGRSLDRPLRGADVGGDAPRAQQRHAGVIVRVVAHEVSALGDRAGEARVRLRPASLDEEGRRDPGRRQRVEDLLGATGSMAAVRVLCVEGQRDADRHFSTPVMTMPRVKNRWVSRNAITGMTRVISVPAWM